MSRERRRRNSSASRTAGAAEPDVRIVSAPYRCGPAVATADGGPRTPQRTSAPSGCDAVGWLSSSRTAEPGATTASGKSNLLAVPPLRCGRCGDSPAALAGEASCRGRQASVSRDETGIDHDQTPPSGKSRRPRIGHGERLPARAQRTAAGEQSMLSAASVEGDRL